MAAVAEALTFSRAGWSSLLRRRLLAHLVVDKPSSLDELGDLVCYMACKQKPVSRLHLVGKSHECQGIAADGEGHPPTDDLWRLLHVIDGSNGETPVGNWTPEVRAHQVVPEVLAADIVRRLAHQRPSHGRACGRRCGRSAGEAALRTNHTGVEGATERVLHTFINTICI